MTYQWKVTSTQTINHPKIFEHLQLKGICRYQVEFHQWNTVIIQLKEEIREKRAMMLRYQNQARSLNMQIDNRQAEESQMIWEHLNPNDVAAAECVEYQLLEEISNIEEQIDDIEDEITNMNILNQDI